MNNSESVKWGELRLEAGMTLADAAARSGYSQATINGLEKHGEGSTRLQERLLDVYGANKVSEGVGVDWRERAITAEAELRAIKSRLLELGEGTFKGYPKPKPQPKKKGQTP